MNVIVMKDMKVWVLVVLLITEIISTSLTNNFVSIHRETLEPRIGDGRTCVDINECTGSGLHRCRTTFRVQLTVQVGPIQEKQLYESNRSIIYGP